MSDGRVVIDITADTKEYQAAVTSLNASTQQQIALMGGAIKGVGVGMTAAITVPLIAMGVAAVKSAMEFENALASVRKTVDTTEEGYKRLAEGARELSERHIVSAAQLLELESLGGQLGIAEGNLQEFAETAANFELATDIGAEEAAVQMAQFKNITGMTESELTNFSSSIVALGNNSAAFESQIMDMSMRIAGAGTQIGMTESDILALSASLASVGISAEAGGTAISTVMSQIDRDVAWNTETLGTWAKTAGMSAETFAQTWKNEPIVAMQAIMSGMNETAQSGGNLNLVLDELGIGAIRQTDTLKRLSKASEVLTGSVDLSTQAWIDNTAMQDEVDKRLMTTESQLTILQNKLTNVATDIGGPLLGAINSLINAVQPALEVIASLARGFAEMPAPLQSIVIGLGGTAIAMGPVLTAFGKFMEKSAESKKRWADMQKAQEAYAKASETVARKEEIATAKSTARAAKESADASRVALAKEKEKLARLQNATAVDKEEISKAKSAIKGELENIQTQKSIQAKAQETIARDAATTATTKEGIANTVASVGKGVHTAATDMLTRAQVALNTAMTTNPVGLVISALAILAPLAISVAGAIGGACGAQRDLTQSSDDLVRSTGKMNNSYDEWIKRVKEGEQSFDLYRQGVEGAVSAGNTLKKIQTELREESKKTITVYDQYGFATEEMSSRYYELKDAEKEALEALEGYENGTEGMVDALRAQADTARIAEEQVRINGDAYQYTEEELQRWGITQQDINLALLDHTEAIIEADEALVNLQDDIRNYADQNPAFKSALEDSGLSVEELGTRLGNLGIDFSDFAQSFDDCVRDISSGLNVIDTESQVSLEKLMENLRVNAEATANWKDNTMTVWNAVPAELRPAVQSMIDAGPDQFGLAMQQLAGLSQEEITAMVGDMSRYTDSATQDLTDLLFSTSSFGGTLADNLRLPDGTLNYEAIADSLRLAGFNATTIANLTSSDIAAELGIDESEIDMSQLTAAVESEIDTAATTAQTSGSEIPQSMAEGVNENAGVVTTAVNGVVTTAVQNTNTDLSAQGPAMMGSLASGISAGAPAVVSAVQTVMTSVNSSIANTSLSPAGNTTIQTLASGITAGQVHVTNATTALLTAITTLITNENFQPLGLAKMTQLEAGIKSGEARTRAAAASIVRTVITMLEEAVSGAYSVGYNMSAGMARGITGGGWQVYEAAKAVARQALIDAKNEAVVESPSKKWDEELGQMMGLGAAQGLDKSTSEVEDASVRLMVAAERAAQRGLDQFLHGIDLGDLSASTLLALSPQVGQTTNSVTTIITNNYTIDGKVYKEGSPHADALELLADAKKINRMGVMA